MGEERRRTDRDEKADRADEVPDANARGARRVKKEQQRDGADERDQARVHVDLCEVGTTDVVAKTDEPAA